MTKYIPREKLEHLIWTPQEDVPPQQPNASPSESIQSSLEGNYILMDTTSTYALGAEALRVACRDSNPHPIHTYDLISDDKEIQIYRPLTFHENLRARVEDFNREYDESGAQRTLDDRLRLLARWLDSCTGVAYRRKTSKMKIIPVSQDLIEIDANFRDHYLAVDYTSLDGEELDRSKGKYNELLTETEVIEHPAWLAAVNGDKALLKEYAGIVFAQLKERYKRDTGMIFWIRDTTATDELRALFVYNLDNYSSAYGNISLNKYGSFLLVAPVGAP